MTTIPKHRFPPTDHVGNVAALLTGTPGSERVRVLQDYVQGQPELAKNPAAANRVLSHALTQVPLDGAEGKALRARVAHGLEAAIEAAEPVGPDNLLPAPLPVPATVEELTFVPKLPSGFVTTDELSPNADVYAGQKRVHAALERGLATRAPGYDVFLSGPCDGAAMDTIQVKVRELADAMPKPPDLVFAQNFDDPTRPTLLRLEPGTANELRQRMEKLVQYVAMELIADVQEKAEELSAGGQEAKTSYDTALQALREKAEGAGVELNVEESGLHLVAVRMPAEFWPKEAADAALARTSTAEERAFIEHAYQRFVDTGFVPLNTATGLARAELERAAEQGKAVLQDLGPDFEALAELGQRAQGEADAVRDDALKQTIASALAPVRSCFAGRAAVLEYLDAVQTHLTEQAPLLAKVVGAAEEDSETSSGAQEALVDLLASYEVKVVADHTKTRGAPVVRIDVPDLEKLFGSVELSSDQHLPGALPPCHLDIEPGALLAANGGFLVLNVGSAPHLAGEILFRLTHALATALEIEPNERVMAPRGSFAKPEPIELNVKVVVLGGDDISYEAACAQLPGFAGVFGQYGSFARVLDNDAAYTEAYAGWVGHLCTTEKLPHLDRGAMAEVLRQAAREAGDQNQLWAISPQTSDLVRDAALRAKHEGASITSERHVTAAVAHRRFMFSDYYEHFIKSHADKTINVATRGWAVGQVNGLVVMGGSEFRYGGPARVSVRVSMNGSDHEPIVNIDDQSDMAGPLFKKATATVSNWFRGVFGQGTPLRLRANTVMEQCYSGVDGDSATSTTAYALLSALSGLPVRQDLAITGSMDSQGRVQAIGGENEKIEGFYDTCVAQGGLTGHQGVIIPESNVKGLVLRPDVVEAIRARKFHIYPVSTVERGIEILTGKEAGAFEPYTDEELAQLRASGSAEDTAAAARGGRWTPGSVLERVAQKVEEYAQRAVLHGDVAKRLAAAARTKGVAGTSGADGGASA